MSSKAPSQQQQQPQTTTVTTQSYTESAEFFQLPKKYARRKMMADEIDVINGGGI